MLKKEKEIHNSEIQVSFVSFGDSSHIQGIAIFLTGFSHL
jgi:hypothetical protein